MPVDSQPRIWSAGFLAVFVINIVIGFAQFMTVTLVPTMAQSLGASATVIGTVTGLFAFTSLAMRPFSGPATLWLRNRALLVVTLAILMGAFALYAATASVATLVAARLLHGAGMGFLGPVTLALVSATLPPERMTQGIAVFSLGQAVSTALGPSTGLWLAAHLGYSGAYLVSELFLLVALALTPLVPEPPHEGRANGVAQIRGRQARSRRPGSHNRGPSPVLRVGWRDVIAPEAVVPALVIFCLAGAYSGVNAFIVLYGHAVGVSEIGVFFTVYAITILFSRPVAGRIADQHGLLSVVVPAMVVFGLAFVVIAQAHSLEAFLVGACLSALGYGVCQPTIQTWCLTSVNPERRGVAGNTNYIGVDLAYLVMPTVAGALVSRAQSAGATTAQAYSLMFFSLIALVVAALTVLLTLGRRRIPDAMLSHD